MFGKLGAKLKDLFTRKTYDEEYFNELEDILIEGDLGPKMTEEICQEVREEAKKNKNLTDEDLQKLVKAKLAPTVSASVPALDLERPNVWLILGVNGVGKTTTIAKLAKMYSGKGIDVVLCAGDTFRAAAVDQLDIHARRLGVRIVKQPTGSDPGAVVFDAITSIQSKGRGLLLVDTAGRMHTRENLVKELGKIDKVVRAKGVDDAHYKKFLVIDSTTGQNGFSQAEQFGKAVKIDALILSKYDSLSKGGALCQIGEKLHIPVAFVGTGEGYGDIHPFDKDEFLDTLVGLGS